MLFVIIVLSISVIGLIIYIYILQKQMHVINQILEHRLLNDSRQPITLELINKQLSLVASNINHCLKVEEDLRLKTIRDENEFKELIANISHDLRTPLTVIKGYLQLLENQDANDSQKEKLIMAKEYAEKLGTMIDSFFEYSYALHHHLSPIMEEVNLTNIITEVVVAYIPNFEEVNKRIILNDHHSIIAKVDKEMFHRVLENVLRNAIKYAKDDIIIDLVTNQNQVIINFTNHIQEDAHIDSKRLFDRFYSADIRRDNTTGLGLAIVKQLMESMSGTVEAEINQNNLTISLLLKR